MGKVFGTHRVWRREGRWERVLARLREQERPRQGRNPPPVRRSWTARAYGPPKGGPDGFDGAKKLNGRKRYPLVDTLGLVCRLGC